MTNNLDLQPSRKKNVAQKMPTWFREPRLSGNHLATTTGDKQMWKCPQALANAKGDTRQQHRAPKECKLRHATTTPQTTQMGWDTGAAHGF
jgi:hypothetical protein